MSEQHRCTQPRRVVSPVRTSVVHRPPINLSNYLTTKISRYWPIKLSCLARLPLADDINCNNLTHTYNKRHSSTAFIRTLVLLLLQSESTFTTTDAEQCDFYWPVLFTTTFVALISIEVKGHFCLIGLLLLWMLKYAIQRRLLLL